jgi:hypothetical protein
MRIDSHAINERFRLLTHRIYAEALARDPSLLDRARMIVSERLGSDIVTFSDRMWATLLTLTVEDVRQAIVQEGPEGSTLRSGSPLSVLLGISDPEQRTMLWRQAAMELEHMRTSPMRSAS